jgi:hypothetical protein
MRRRSGFRSGNFFGVAPNTFIGGVASTIPDAATLATKLNISESEIKSFEIVGSDIKAAININYVMPTAAFKNNTNITYFDDQGNNCTLLNRECFQFCSNLTYVYFNGCKEIENVVFSYCTSLSDIQFNALETITGGFVLNRTLVQDCDFPNLISLNAQAFRSEINPANQTRFNIPNCATIGDTVGNNSVFLNINSGCEIICPTSLQTANAGGEEGDIAYARGRGCTITYV